MTITQTEEIDVRTRIVAMVVITLITALFIAAVAGAFRSGNSFLGVEFGEGVHVPNHPGPTRQLSPGRVEGAQAE